MPPRGEVGVVDVVDVIVDVDVVGVSAQYRVEKTFFVGETKSNLVLLCYAKRS